MLAKQKLRVLDAALTSVAVWKSDLSNTNVYDRRAMWLEASVHIQLTKRNNLRLTTGGY